LLLYNNVLCLYIKNGTKILSLLAFLMKDHTYLKSYLMDLIVIDYPTEKKRFKLIYSLLSYKTNIRLNLMTFTTESTPVVSLTTVYPSCNWLEREAWDLFGICFFNHPDLRRIFTDYSFYGFALRKDFPLTGFVELQYNFNQKRITQNFVSLSQDLRLYHYISPWVSRVQK